MENDEILHVFKALSQVELGKTINPTQVVIRCPICGEPGKVRTHGHCYVGLIDNHPPMVYHCFINECSGIVTPSFLRDVGIYDNELETILNIFNKTKLDKETRKILLRKKIRENVSIPIDYDRNMQRKISYLKDRLKINFSIQECIDYKIIFSLRKFLEENKITENYKYRKIANIIENDYIGFLSKENDYIIFRDITGKSKLRYIKYDLFNNIDSKIIYTLPSECDIFSSDINLNVAEGTFDILSLYYLNNKNNINNIYAACCGSGFINTIKYFIKLGFVSNLNINIYSDKDKKPYFYKKLYFELKPWVKSINIFYNTLEKDYGVPQDRIDIQKISIDALFG